MQTPGPRAHPRFHSCFRPFRSALPAAAAALLLAGCASVSPDGLRGDVAAFDPAIQPIIAELA